jgi:uncharacterized membrane protein
MKSIRRRHRTAPSFPSGLERIIALSDAVIAIAITLLVLSFDIPQTVGELAGNPRQALGHLFPNLMGYAVSFWVIALYWVAHHRCFRYIRKYDRRLMYINFLFLMFIAFMPFPTALLFGSPSSPFPVVLYAGTAAGMGLSLALLWIYAARHRFIAAGTSPATVRDIRLNLLLPPAVFLLSAAAAPVNVAVAMFLWLLLVPVYVLRRHREVSVIGDEMP